MTKQELKKQLNRKVKIIDIFEQLGINLAYGSGDYPVSFGYLKDYKIDSIKHANILEITSTITYNEYQIILKYLHSFTKEDVFENILITHVASSELRDFYRRKAYLKTKI